MWRTPVSVLTRELFFWCLAYTLIGVALNHAEVMLWGGVITGSVAICSVIASVAKNRTRVQVIQRGAASRAVLGRPRRIPMIHELFRGQRESTYRMPYTFEDATGQTVKSSVWLCGCARQYLPPNSTEMVAYDPASPRSSVLLRVAVMVAPH